MKKILAVLFSLPLLMGAIFYGSHNLKTGDIVGLGALFTGITNGFYAKSGGAIGGSVIISNSLQVRGNQTNLQPLYLESDLNMYAGNHIRMSNGDISGVAQFSFNTSPALAVDNITNIIIDDDDDLPTSGAVYDVSKWPASSFFFDGAVYSNLYKNYIGRSTARVSRVFMRAGTAPTGAALIADVRIGGASVFSNITMMPRVADGANASSNWVYALPASNTFADQSALQVFIIQVGSTTPGSDVSVAIEYEQ